MIHEEDIEMKRTWGFFAVQRKDDFSCYRKDACKLSGTYEAFPYSSII